MKNNLFTNQFRALYLAAFFIILALPILTIPPWFFPPDWPKTVIFRSILAVITTLFVFQAFFKGQSFPWQHLKKNGVAWILAGFFTILLLSTIFSVDPGFSFWGNPLRGGGFISYAFYILFALLTFVLFKREDWAKAWNVSIVIGVVVSLVAVIQYYGLFSSIFLPTPDRPASTIGNPILLAIYLVLLLFITVAFLIKDKRWILKVVYGLALLLFLFVILITGSRAAYLGIIIGGIYFLLSYPKKLPAIKITVGILLLIVGGIIFYTNTQTQFPAFLEKNQVFQSVLPRLSVVSFLSDTRFPAWQVGFKGFLEKPLLGFGMENYSVAFDKYYDGSVGIKEVQWWDRAHNTPLEIAVTGGIFALILYVFLFIIVCYKLNKVKHQEPSAHALQATLIAYFIANIFSFDSFPSYLVFFLAIGYSMHLSCQQSPLPVTIPGKHLPYKKTLFGILVVLGVWFLWHDNITPFFINEKINEADTLVGQKNCSQTFLTMDKALQEHSFLDSYARLKYAEFVKKCTEAYPQNTSTYIQRGREVIKEAVKIQPNYTRYWIFLANTTNSLAAKESDETTKRALIEETKEYLDKALALAPEHQEIYIELAAMAINAKDYQKAIDYSNTCVSLNSDLPDCYFQLALSQIYVKNILDAQKNILIAKNKGYNIDSEQSLGKLSDAYGSITDYPNLVSIYEKLTSMNPTIAQYHSSLAFFYKQVHQYQNARQQALRVLDLSPESKQNVEEFLKTLP